METMALRVTPYKARGPSLIRGLNDAGTKTITIDREDGWGAEFKTNVPHPYTVIQTIVRKIQWEPDESGQRSQETMAIPAGTRVLERRFLAYWDNFHADGTGIQDTKRKDSHYWRARDMKMVYSHRTYAAPPPGGYPPPSPELHM